MKKKVLLIALMVALFVCIFAISASAETMSRYIEFDVLLDGEIEYQTVYSAEGKSDPWTVYVAFGNDFYTNPDPTLGTVIDKTKIVKIDMSKATGHGFNNNNVKQLLAASDNSVFENVTEIKFPVNPGNFNFIGGSVCYGWTSLTTIDFGSANQTGDDSFGNCTAIKELTIPEQITKINNRSFKGCTGLTTVYFNGDNQTGTGIFQDCTALTTVVFGSKVTYIKGGMFQGCSSLTEISIPEGVKEIGGTAFYGTKLVKLHVPSTVTFIGMQVLEDVKTFTTLTFAENSQLKAIDHRSFNGSSLSGDLVLPYGLEDIDYSAFSSTLITSVKIPSTVTDEKLINEKNQNEYYSVFYNCTKLEYAELSGASLGDNFFEGCTSLKAISIPEGVKKINRRAFYNCTSLKAVYLPSTLETIGTESGWDRGVFCFCTNLYFVNEPFAVRDENGVILGENFVMPTEPEVAFMPASLTTIFGAEFRECKQINRYVVLPTGITKIENWEGAFSSTGIENKKGAVTYIFLGDMQKLCYSAREGRYKNVSFVFANPNDTDITSLTVQLGYRAAAANGFAYFCAGNVVYDLNSFIAENETYIVQTDDFAKTIYTEETQPHFADPNKTIVSEPDCVTNAFHTKYCFCGDKAGVTEVEGTALGHNHDITNGAILLAITYSDYTKDGNKSVKCSRCEVLDTQIANKIIIDETGFSAKINGNGITFGYNIDNVALAELKSVYENAQFGFVTAVKSYLGSDNPLDANANEVALEKGKVLKADVTSDIIDNGITRVDFKLVGDIWNSKVDLDGNAENGAEVAIKDISFVMSAYVYANDTVSYINANNGAPQEVIYSTLIA